MHNDIAYIQQALLKLMTWIDQNGWEGIDHYDIMDNVIFRKLVKRKLSNYFAIMLLDTIPEVLRVLSQTKPKRNAKAIALLAQAYLDYYHCTKNEKYLKESIEAVDWLLANASPQYSYYCWGYPFNWQAEKLILAGTPSGVVTANVVDAFLALYAQTKERKYLNACVSACRFFHEYLHIEYLSGNEISFSYTPFDKEICHNANLLVATAIIKTASVTSEIDTKLAWKAVRFVLNQQNENGSWYYLYPIGRIDPYHTGFILRSLHSIYSISASEELKKPIFRGIEYFEKHLLDTNLIPFYRVGYRYPIDIHSCSEAVLCFTNLSSLYPQLIEKAEKIARWTITNMQDSKGFFYYRKYPFHKVKIAYFRWGQAWIFRSLAVLVRKLHQIS